MDGGSSLVQIDHVVGKGQVPFQTGWWLAAQVAGKISLVITGEGQPGADPLPAQAEPAQARREEGRTGAASSSEGLGQQRVRDALGVSQETLQA